MNVGKRKMVQGKDYNNTSTIGTRQHGTNNREQTEKHACFCIYDSEWDSEE